MSERTRGIILDVDGTLVDSNDAHAHAWVEALWEAGYPTGFEQVRRLIGMGGDKLIPEVTGLDKDSPQGRELSRRRGEIFRESYLPRLRAFPRTRELLSRMREGGMKLAVASSAEKEELASLLRVAGAEGLIQAAASSGDAERSKPDPDIVRAALGRLGLPAGETVMVGDTPYDVQAALRAGIRAIALRTGGWDDRSLDGAAAIYDDPADLLAHWDAALGA